MSKKRRIGILTGGGDCPGLNAAIRAVSKRAIRDFQMEVIGFEDGFLGLVENRFRKLSDLDVSGILARGGTILGTSNRANPFWFPVLRDGKEVYEDVSKKAFKNYQHLGLEGLVTLGGDGTLKIAQQLLALGLEIVAIPKTIDNDLSGTDFTFGFDSAVSIVTEAMDRIHTTAESHHRVMIVEVMGRYAGWIALYGGVAGGADVILIPEIPFDVDKICGKVWERQMEGKNFSMVVVAEGAFPKKGKPVVRKMIKASPDPVRLGGIAAFLAEKIEKKTELECRFTVLGHLQRGGSPTAFDRLLATQFGHAALDLLLKKDFGKMVAFQKGEMRAVPLRDAVEELKKVPLNHPLMLAARSVGTAFGD
ncbi:MAG: 6-phosphofructokinase [Chlamydiae bacterium]|nr:6-phosphofructokinase [Chlamydiota bacterium]MBI3266546.1 6-phosphofructokinase [Chlamydiota bacterium]